MASTATVSLAPQHQQERQYSESEFIFFVFRLTIEECNGNGAVSARVITPSDPQQRGAQLSVFFGVDIVKVFKELTKRGVVVSESWLMNAYPDSKSNFMHYNCFIAFVVVWQARTWRLAVGSSSPLQHIPRRSSLRDVTQTSDDVTLMINTLNNSHSTL